MVDLNKIPEFLGQIKEAFSQISAADVGNFLGRVVTYGQNNPMYLVVAAIVLAVLYGAYRICKKTNNDPQKWFNNPEHEARLQAIEKKMEGCPLIKQKTQLSGQLVTHQARILEIDSKLLKTNLKKEAIEHLTKEKIALEAGVPVIRRMTDNVQSLINAKYSPLGMHVSFA